MGLSDGPAKLRQRLASGPAMIIPGAFNALSAKMVQEAGFEAVYATGAGIANSFLGVPDLGLLTLSELTAHTRAMVAATTVPVLVDVDTGFGGVHNVARTVSEMEAAGAAAVQIEDQTFPKRCGHFDGKDVVPAEEMVAKLVAAIDSRDDLLVIARTDAIAVEGFEPAVERARAYRDAGADVIFVEAPTSVEEVRALPTLVDAPLLINMVEEGVTPLLPPDELDALGYRVIAFANFGLRAIMKCLREKLSDLHSAGTSADLGDHILSWAERQATVGLDHYDAREQGWRQRAEALVDGSTSDPVGRR